MLTSLPPVVPPDCRVLVLGSMPGELSLARREYYAHPRNRFWQVMGELCDAHPALGYSDRLDRLGRCGIGLWDVLQHCVRAGSLDTGIRRESEITNDFHTLFARHPALRVVAFNGSKAAHTFHRKVLPELDDQVAARATLVDMPSTSPANASRSLSDLLREWSRILPYLRRT